MVTKEQATDPRWHKYIEGKAHRNISTVACAAGGSPLWYPENIRKERVIMCPVYHQGTEPNHPREAGLFRLKAACSQAVDNNTAVLIHCNRSFHRGPILAAACMVSGGKYTANEAFNFIHKERQIYPGHLMPLESWPQWEKNSGHARDVEMAHVWVRAQENITRGSCAEQQEHARAGKPSKNLLGAWDQTATKTKKWQPKQCEDPQLTPRTQGAASVASSSARNNERLAARKEGRLDNLEVAQNLVIIEASRATKPPPPTEEDMHNSASGSDNKKKRLAASQDAACSQSDSASKKERLASGDGDDSLWPAASAAAFPPAHGVPPPDTLPTIGHVIQAKQNVPPITDPWTEGAGFALLEATASEPDAASVEEGHDAKMQDAKETLFENRTELNQCDAWDDVPSPNSQEAGKENVRSQPRGRERHRNVVRVKRTRLQQEAEAEADFGREKGEHGYTSSEEQSWSDDEDMLRWKEMSPGERILAMDSQKQRLQLWHKMQQEQNLADDKERLQEMKRPSEELQMFLVSIEFENVLSHDADGCNILHELCRARRTADGIENYDIAIEAVQLAPDTFLSSVPWAGQLQGMTPLHMLCGAKDRNIKQIELLRALLDKNADMCAQDPNGRTPLLCCAGCGWWEGSCILAKYESPMCTVDKWGRNFADLAAKCNNTLMDWWCTQTGRKKTGNKKPPAECKKRENVSASRYDRLATFKGPKGKGKWPQNDWQMDQSWGSQGSAS